MIAGAISHLGCLSESGCGMDALRKGMADGPRLVGARLRRGRLGSKLDAPA